MKLKKNGVAHIILYSIPYKNAIITSSPWLIEITLLDNPVNKPIRVPIMKLPFLVFPPWYNFLNQIVNRFILRFLSSLFYKDIIFAYKVRD